MCDAPGDTDETPCHPPDWKSSHDRTYETLELQQATTSHNPASHDKGEGSSLPLPFADRARRTLSHACSAAAPRQPDL